MELEPENSRVLVPAGVLAFNLGRIEESIGFYRRAAERDPLRPGAFGNLGVALDAADRLIEAEAAYRKALILAPKIPGIYAQLAVNLAAQGKGEEALAEARRDSYEPFMHWALALVHDKLGHRTESDRALGELLEKYPIRWRVRSRRCTRCEATDAAFEWLERAYTVRDSGLAEIKSRRQFRSLYGDRRWEAFQKKMGF